MKTYLIVFSWYKKVVQLENEYDLDRYCDEIPLMIIELDDKTIEEISKLRG